MNSVLILLVIIYGLSLIASFLAITLALPLEQRQEELTLLIAIEGVLIAAALGFYFGKKT
jgi:Na+-transporting NADH:ubiquinone oxidoreductase subunit NqrC